MQKEQVNAHILHLGDCLDVMKTLPDNSVDSVVSDAPYGLGFLGKEWDTFDKNQFGKKGEEGENDLKVKKNFNILPRYKTTGLYQFSFDWATEAFRILKPGGYLLSFAGSRTYHRIACGIEDAGFKIKDMIGWLYASGFPKNYNIGKTVDDLQGNNREVVGKVSAGKTALGQDSGWNKHNNRTQIEVTKGGSEWEGWGTALKPAIEPIVMARKPITEKNIVENVLKWGTGGINIDECRIKHSEPVKKTKRPSEPGRGVVWNKDNCGFRKKQNDLASASPQGRFPANIIHDGSEAVERILGNASRFFYCAKPSADEKNEGLDDLEEKSMQEYGIEKFNTTRKNIHPTVKPTKLMQNLIRLVTQENGVVLDPFMGSGTTGVACELENMKFIGIEKEPEYFEIAIARIKHSGIAQKLF